MSLDTGTAILILGAFVLPGFIALILRERLYLVRGEDAPFERLLSALLDSAVIYGVLLVAATISSRPSRSSSCYLGSWPSSAPGGWPQNGSDHLYSASRWAPMHTT